MTISEDSITIWPLGSTKDKRLTRAQARTCVPPYLPPLNEKFNPGDLTAHKDIRGRNMTAAQALRAGVIHQSMVKTPEEMLGNANGNRQALHKLRDKAEDIRRSAEESERQALEARKKLAEKKATPTKDEDK